MFLNIIRKRKGKYHLVSHKGKTLGVHATREEALKQEQAIEIAKRARQLADNIGMFLAEQERDEKGRFSGPGGGSGSDATSKANKATENATNTASSHESAYRLHREAEAEHMKQNNTKQADYHRRQAGFHKQQADTMRPPNQPEKLGGGPGGSKESPHWVDPRKSSYDKIDAKPNDKRSHADKMSDRQQLERLTKQDRQDLYSPRPLREGNRGGHVERRPDYKPLREARPGLMVKTHQDTEGPAGHPKFHEKGPTKRSPKK